MHQLQNQHVRVGIDAAGRWRELVARASGWNYADGAAGGALWRLIYQRGPVLENEVRADACAPTITAAADRLVLHYPSVAGDDGPLAVRVTIEVTLRDDETHWAIELANDEPGVVVREVHFPQLAPCRPRAGQALIWSPQGGQRIADPRAWLTPPPAPYAGPGENDAARWTLYPGGTAATNCFLFAGPQDGLYVASHDPSFQQTLHLLRRRAGELECALVKYPYLATGGRVRIEGYVVAPYQGSWHVAADKYRAWVQTWFGPPREAERDTSVGPPWAPAATGWQRFIVRDGNPDQRAALARAVRAAQQAGTRAVVSFHARWIDRNSDYYRAVGHRLAMKDAEGNEIHETCPACPPASPGTALRVFGHKTFACACCACAEWFDQLKRLADLAIDLGCDGVCFDQLGAGDAYQCCDPAHGHPVPHTTLYAAKADLLARLRRYGRERRPGMALGTGGITDVTAQHADFVRAAWDECGPRADAPAAASAAPAERFIDFFRYTFPEVILSDGGADEDADMERRVNLALLKGLRSEADSAIGSAAATAAPRDEAWLAAANRLRHKYADLLLAGRYRDTLGFLLENPQIDARAFTAGTRLAVVLTQSRLPGAATRLVAEGYELADHDGLGQFSVRPWGAGLEVRLQRHALVVAVFQRDSTPAGSG